MRDFTAIITAAGKGSRTGLNKNKLLVDIGGQTVLDKTINAFLKSNLFDNVIITASKEDFEQIKNAYPTLSVVVGGDTRTQSVKNALKTVKTNFVVIHDGARPFVGQKLIKDCVDLTRLENSAIPVIPTKDTLIKIDDKPAYVGKSGYYNIQTPQGFATKEIINAYEQAGNNVFNDDGEVYNKFVAPIHTYVGDIDNTKITFIEDFELLKDKFRFGVGFDCHKLVENRKLILGGITIPHEKGLLGHSDADVLTHAIMDAILSACAMRDIGYHFPDTDKTYKDANSIDLLRKVLYIIAQKGYKVESVSAVIMAEKPKLLKHIPLITENLASVLNLTADKVGIGATTLEGLGFVGREEGICVHANATLSR